jgi:hypothetical protein
MFRIMDETDRRGTALMLALVVIVLLVGVAGVAMQQVLARAQRSEVVIDDAKAFEAAEAGLDAAIRDLNAGGSGCLGLGWTTNGLALRVIGKPNFFTGQTGAWDIAVWDDSSAGGGNEDCAIDANELKKPNFTVIGPGGWDPASSDGVLFAGQVYIDNQQQGSPVYDRFKSKTTGHGVSHTDANCNCPHWPRPQPREFDFYKHAVTAGDIRFFTFAIPWECDGIDNDGVGVPNGDDSWEKGWYTIWSTGFVNNRRADGTYARVYRFATVEACVRRVFNLSKLAPGAAVEFQIAPYSP